MGVEVSDERAGDDGLDAGVAEETGIATARGADFARRAAGEFLGDLKPERIGVEH